MQQEDIQTARGIKNKFLQLIKVSIDSKAHKFSYPIEEISDASIIPFEFGPKNGMSEHKFLDSI